MSTDLVTVPAQSGELDVMTLGKILAQSGYFKDTRDAAQAIVKVLAGRELGFGPIASMMGVKVTSQGAIILAANLQAAAVRRSGVYDYEITELTDDRCSITFLRKSPKTGEWVKSGDSTFTIKDLDRAEAGKLVAPGATRTMKDRFPRNMLFARAISNGVKWFCPDVTSGIPVYDESELPADTGPALTMVDTSTGEITKAQPIAQAEPTNGAGNGQESPVEVVDPHAVTDAQRRMFHAVGKKIYGKEWGDVGKAMIREMTGGSEHTSDMFKAQMTRLIDQLKAEEASLMAAEALTGEQATAELFGDAS